MSFAPQVGPCVDDSQQAGEQPRPSMDAGNLWIKIWESDGFHAQKAGI